MTVTEWAICVETRLTDGTRERREIYDKATGNLYYDSDGTGSSSQIKVATLANKANVTLSDLQII
ncbi:MAG: hypothetical protein K0S56_78 [Microvirga sp.]|jgi:Ca2+-binding RTX toxin-like protein|nr:hypothetical protein [Microvirga sp.]